LEFDIGILLDVYFSLIGNGVGLSGTAACALHRVPWESQTRVRVRYDIVPGVELLARYGIWYARNEVVKIPHPAEVPKT
jgi:hypothetical protein